MVRAMSFQKSRWERGGDTDIGHVVCIWDFPDHIKSYPFFIVQSISNFFSFKTIKEIKF